MPGEVDEVLQLRVLRQGLQQSFDYQFKRTSIVDEVSDCSVDAAAFLAIPSCCALWTMDVKSLILPTTGSVARAGARSSLILRNTDETSSYTRLLICRRYGQCLSLIIGRGGRGAEPKPPAAATWRRSGTVGPTIAGVVAPETLELVKGAP